MPRGPCLCPVMSVREWTLALLYVGVEPLARLVWAAKSSPKLTSTPFLWSRPPFTEMHLSTPQQHARWGGREAHRKCVLGASPQSVVRAHLPTGAWADQNQEPDAHMPQNKRSPCTRTAEAHTPRPVLRSPRGPRAPPLESRPRALRLEKGPHKAVRAQRSQNIGHRKTLFKVRADFRR